MKTALRLSIRRCSLALAAGVVLFATQANATVVTLGNGTVTWLEATYMPGTIVFTLSSGDTNCPPGKYLTFVSSNTEQTKAIYATLLANMLSGRQAYVYYDDSNWNTGPFGSSGCRITNIGTN